MNVNAAGIIRNRSMMTKLAYQLLNDRNILISADGADKFGFVFVVCFYQSTALFFLCFYTAVIGEFPNPPLPV